MADIIKGLFGGPKPAAPAAQQPVDADFADFAAAPSPEAAPSAALGSIPAEPTFTSHPVAQRPYTKWYRIDERTTIKDFYAELFVLPIICVLILCHLWGTRKNKTKAKYWIAAHAPVLSTEFAVVGFGTGARIPPADEVASEGLLKAAEHQIDPTTLIKERSKCLFLSYATGRQNIAFVDVKINLARRYNPPLVAAESIYGFLFEAFPQALDTVETVCYPFDGHESALVPRIPGTELEYKGKSGFEGFVWAVVHKDRMKKLRQNRYDVSLTSTKEHAKLPNWATVMSESAEITDTFLTSDLVSAIQAFGEDFQSLVVTDMPVDAPKTLEDLVPKKRIILTTTYGASAFEPSSPALLAATVRLADQIVATKLRPEVLKRVRATRDDEAKKIKKIDDLEKAEERKLAADKAKKDERERRLKGMSADEQRRFLDKERERDQRKGMSKRSTKA